jgi:hypothetical protein
MAQGKGGGGGGSVLLLLLLLGVLGGIGSWNYKRNVAAETDTPRPYRTYSDAQLEQLRAAYAAKVDELSGRYSKLSDRRVKAADGKMLGDAIDEFARVQRASGVTRSVGQQLSQDEVSLSAIEAEQALRKRLGGATPSFWRRVLMPPA